MRPGTSDHKVFALLDCAFPDLCVTIWIGQDRVNLVASMRAAEVFTEAEGAVLELTEQGTLIAGAARGVNCHRRRLGKCRPALRRGPPARGRGGAHRPHQHLHMPQRQLPEACRRLPARALGQTRRTPPRSTIRPDARVSNIMVSSGGRASLANPPVRLQSARAQIRGELLGPRRWSILRLPRRSLLRKNACAPGVEMTKSRRRSLRSWKLRVGPSWVPITRSGSLSGRDTSLSLRHQSLPFAFSRSLPFTLSENDLSFQCWS